MNEIDQYIIDILNKIDCIREELNSILVDRKHAIDLSIVALVSRENIILLGPPGTAKSLLASELCKRIINQKYFQRLLTKFTKESELFVSGQGIVEEYKQDDEIGQQIKVTKIKTYHENMLPQANIAFLDEVFKGNSAILNSLLSLMNERIYYTNEGKPISSQLIMLFGASNERPTPEDGLEALYDRFLIRYYVGYLEGIDFKKLLQQSAGADNLSNEPKQYIDINELNILHEYLNKIIIPDSIINSIYQFRERIDSHPNLKILKPSDRRMKNSLKVLKANALLRRKITVEKADVEQVYPYILWDTAPGASNNLKIQLLHELIEELKKGNEKIQNILEYNKNCEEYKTQFDELNQNIRKIRNDNSKFKELVEQFNEKVTKITAALDTYKKEIERIDTSEFDEIDKSLVRNALNKIETLSKEIEKQVYEYICILRNI